MRLSVILPNLDSPTVDRAVDSVWAQRAAEPLEVLVVGRDGPGRLRARRDVKLIETPQPLLPGAARNEGMLRAQGDVFVFLDADCVAQPGWLEAHAQRQRQGRTVVGGAVLWDTNDPWVHADNLGMFHEFTASAASGPRPYLPTLNLSVARAAAAEVGMMDPALRCGEDLDWTIRLAGAGHEPWFEPGARVEHRPPRANLTELWAHHRRTGRWMPGVRQRYPEVFGAPAWLYRPWLLAPLAPGIASAAALRIALRSRDGPAAWRAFPALVLTKLAWCAGAVRPVAVASRGLRPTLE